MNDETNFDELSKKAFETNAMEDLNRLFGAVFRLEEWQFVARGELPNVNPYVVSHPETADNQPMICAFTDGGRLMRFARENNLTEADGSCQVLTIPVAGIVEYLEQFIELGAYGVWFNADSQSDGFFVPIKQLRPIREHLAKLNQPVSETDAARKRQDDLANYGMAQTAGGDFEQILNLNLRGVVDFDASVSPFYETIAPLLADYQGTGEFLTLMAFDPNGKSEQTENVVENRHGAYLQMRRFNYLNPKNNVRIGVESIHSNRLRHIETNAELLVSFELCKNLDNQTAVLYYAFQGQKSEVLKLSAVIQPLLEKANYQSVA